RGAEEFPAAVRRELERAFSISAAAGLLALAGRTPAEALPPAAGFWKGFVHEYLTQVSHLPRLREDGWQGGPRVPEGEALEAIRQSAPPLPGIEYLSGT